MNDLKGGTDTGMVKITVNGEAIKEGNADAIQDHENNGDQSTSDNTNGGNDVKSKKSDSTPTSGQGAGSGNPDTGQTEIPP